MKVYLFLAVCLLLSYETYGACYQQWLIEPGDEMCELDSTWEDKEACLTCHCENYGFLAVCCDMNPSPVISQLTKRKIC